MVLEADLTDGFDARFIAVVSEDEVELLDLTHETVEKLRSKVSALETVDVVANEETLVPALSQLAQTPMFADGILVVLRFAKVSDAEAKVLIEAMENSLTSNYLLISSSKSLPKALQGYLKDKGQIEVSKIGKRGSDYAESCFSRSSLVFSKDAKTVILEALGEDLSMLPSLLLTLESAISGETEVSRDDVQPFLHEIEDLAPWALPDLIVSGKTKEAIELLRKLEKTQIAFPIVLTVVQKRFVELAALSSLGLRSAQDRVSAYQRGTGSAPKAPPFVLERIWREAVNLDLQSFQKIFTILGETERSIRGGSSLEPYVLLELAVARLAAICLSRQRRAISRRR